MKIIDSPYIRNAVLRAVYDENGRRKLPLVVIPSLGGQEKRTGVPKQIPYQVVKNTFSNRIGQISNLSIRISSAEYGQTESDVAHSCAECRCHPAFGGQKLAVSVGTSEGTGVTGSVSDRIRPDGEETGDEF